MKALLFLFLATSLSAGGCSTSGSTTQSGNVAACTSLAPPRLAFPANGATNIAAGTVKLYFFYPNNPGQAFMPPVLTPSSGAQAVNGSAYATPSSTPSGIPSTPSGDMVFESDASLAPATKYTITIGSTTCTNQTYTAGTITTQ